MHDRERAAVRFPRATAGVMATVLAVPGMLLPTVAVGFGMWLALPQVGQRLPRLH